MFYTVSAVFKPHNSEIDLIILEKLRDDNEKQQSKTHIDETLQLKNGSYKNILYFHLKYLIQIG